MSRKLIMAHDFGTSSDKACLFDSQGNFLAEAYYKYPIYYPRSGWAEQDPEDWWSAVKQASCEVMAKSGADPADVAVISFSAQGMAVIPVDADGNLLCQRVMIWMDSRSRQEADHILSRTGVREHYDKTGNSFDIAMYPAAKILWIKKNMPDIYKKTYKFLGTKEYLIHKMTGTISHTDYTEAGIGGFFNLHTHAYDPELLDVSQVDEDKLLPPTDCTNVIGILTRSAAADMGLKEGIPVVLGSWDNFACTTGGGGRTQGNMVTYLGTAGWIGITHDKPLMSPKIMSNVVYIGNGSYFTAIHSNAACAAYDWVIDNVCADLKREKDYYQKAEQLAASIAAGSDGLFFLPALYAGNTFFSDANLCATYLGIKPHHTNAHMIRAAMEGVGFDLMMGSEFFRELGVMPNGAQIIGGGARSNTWMGILASMYGIRLTRPNNLQHIGALGAALHGAVGIGLIPDFEMANEIVRSDDAMEPVALERASYQRFLPVFESFYRQLTPAYKELNIVLNADEAAEDQS